MKRIKFLFAVIVLMCFVGVKQTNAQPVFYIGSQAKAVVYEVDGVQYYGVAEVEYHAVAGIGSKEGLNWVAHGYIQYVFEYVNGEKGALLDYIPLPKKTVKGYDPNIVYYEKMTVSKDGKVLVNAHLPQFYKFPLMY